MVSAAIPEGYSSAKQLHVGQLNEVYSAVRDRDATEVILKLYAGGAPARQLALAQHEFDTLHALVGRGIPRALEVIVEHVSPVLVIERAPGAALASWVGAGLPSPTAFVRVALQLAEILARVHAARFIHGDVSPWNVLVEPTTLQTHLIDFGSAHVLGSSVRAVPGSSGGLGGTLAYIAPEQTGRMNRGADLRSDLYSLGATLYYALSGRPPFESTDALELIHAHIARMPVPPVELRRELPPVLSELVLKLMRKEPDERYRSAGLLHADLELLLEQLEQRGSIDAGFELAARDVPQQPRFSGKLYGRQREIARLHVLRERITAGRASALLVKGDPGSGKSVLIDELRAWLAEASGYLAVGRFDAYRDEPYAGWQTALGSLCQQILVESDARLEVWRLEIRAGLGGIAQALVDLVPDLQFIVREVEPVPALGPRETQVRLSLAVQRFLGVCGHRSRPLVLFLDDVQWSDAGSRFLLEDLLCGELPEGLLLICACRSDLIPTHPFTTLLARLTERRIDIETLVLEPLDADAGVEMLAEALERPVDEVRQLGQLVERKTGNNPGLMRQFIEHIHGKGVLHYRRSEGWRWNLAEIAAADIPDGAVALMTDKIGRLEPGTRALVEFASCVGDEFDIEVLAWLGELERKNLEAGLDALSDAGLIAPCPSGFRFVHGRIREAAQSGIPEGARAQLHYNMARLLLARIPESEQMARVSEIVEHLNRGLAHVDEDLHVGAIRLNLAAGKRALASGAAATSEGYFAVARGLLRETDWATERALGFEVLLHSTDSAILRRDFEGALALLRDLDGRSPSLMESTRIEVKRIQVFVLTQQPEEATRYILHVLRRHGIRLPMHPSAFRARLALRLLLWRMHFCKGALQPAKTADPRCLAPILLIGGAAGITARVDMHLAGLVSCWVMKSNLRHGFFARPQFSLIALATLIQVVLNKPREAERLAQRAQEWADQLPDPVFNPRFHMQLLSVLRPFWTRRRPTLAGMDRVVESMREIGDSEYVYYGRFFKLVYGGLAGENVRKTETGLRELADAVRRSGQNYPDPERCHAVYRLLLSSDPAEFKRTLAESDAWIGANGGSAEVYIRTFWMLVLCVNGQHETAIDQSDKVQARLFRIVPYIHVVDHTFLRGISSAVLATTAHGTARRQHLREFRDCGRHMRRWMKHGGPDFVHMATLLEAEHARLRGDVSRARALYDKAVLGAMKQTYVHHAAMGCERRGHLLVALRRETEACASLREAVALYTRWGAQAKADALEAELRKLDS